MNDAYGRSRGGRVARALGGTMLASGVGMWVYMAAARPWLLRWGATTVEASRALPGDDLVPAPGFQSTRAITIAASPARVWPWLAQMGNHRGGWYSYEGIERLLGAADFVGGRTADRIIPALQAIQVGDTMEIYPTAPLMVARLEPERALVLHIAGDPFNPGPVGRSGPSVKTHVAWSWAFVLEESGPDQTRLLARSRMTIRPAWLTPLFTVEPGWFIMERKMLLGIKARAERAGAEAGWTAMPASAPAPAIANERRHSAYEEAGWPQG